MDAYHPDQAFSLLMKQLELILASGGLNPRHQHTVTPYVKGLTWPTPPTVVVMFIWLFTRHR